MASLIEKYSLPLISAYGGPNLLDTAQRKDSIAQSVEWAKLLKKYGGKVVVIGVQKRNVTTGSAGKATITSRRGATGIWLSKDF